MDKTYLKEIENDLKFKKNQLINSFELLKQDKNRSGGPLTQNLDDQSIDQENFEVVDKLEKLERMEIMNIGNALKKIKNGTFGKCIDCGENISDKRLKALPYAMTCITCASEKLH